MSERPADLPHPQVRQAPEALAEMPRRRVISDLTVREAARALRLTQTEILQLADESEKLDLITGYRVGSGVGETTRQGDYRIEYLLE